MSLQYNHFMAFCFLNIRGKWNMIILVLFSHEYHCGWIMPLFKNKCD